MEVEFTCPERSHDGVEDSELSCGEGSDHDAPGEEPVGAELDETDLLGDVQKAGDSSSVTSGAGLVDHGEEGVGRVGDDGGGNSSNNTGTEGDSEVAHGRGAVRGRAGGSVDGVGGGSLDGELGHGVRDLLEEDGAESSVKSADSLGLEDLAESVSEAVTELRVGDGADAYGLKGAEENVGNGLSHSGGAKVDGGLNGKGREGREEVRRIFGRRSERGAER